jgi:hypothetical protein
MVTLSDAELKQLYAFRMNVVKLQHSLRDRQAALDTAQRTFAAAKRAADADSAKLSPEIRTQLAAVEKELADVTRDLGTAGGRGGRGGGRGGAGGAGGAGAEGALAQAGAGGAAAGRGGRGGRGRAGGNAGAAGATQAGAPTGRAGGAAGGANGGANDEDLNPSGPQQPENLQAKLGTTTEMLNINFNPSPEQKKTVETMPGELEQQAARVKKISSEELPALIKALQSAGVEVKTP